MTNSNASNRVHAGYVSKNGEVVKLSSAILNKYGQIADCDEAGRFLLGHGESFSLLLGNHCESRKVKMRITGDNDSTIISNALILSANQTDGQLERWQNVDQGFIAYRRESEEGCAVGGNSVSEKGGGLIKIVFTIGTKPIPAQCNSWDGDYVTRSSGGMRGGGAFSKGGNSYEEGVMGAGSQTGQAFSSTSFEADEKLAQVEIQLRWVIRRPQAPTDRSVACAPSI
jgi:hypothetical protein